MFMTHSLTKQNKGWLVLGALFFVNLFVIFFFWWQGSSASFGGAAPKGSLLIAFGKLFGLLAEYAILIQLVLIGRVASVERIFGFDRMNIVHRWLGYSLTIFIVGHPLMLILGFGALNHVGFLSQFMTFFTDYEHVRNAFIAFLIFLFIIFISIAPIRRALRYETWYFTHLLMYVAIGLVFGHQIELGDVSEGVALYYWLALNFLIFGLLIAFRFLRPLYLFYKHRFTVEKVVVESDEVVSIYITGRRMEEFRFKSGQYANFTFLRKGFWFTHPFSFSAAPNGRGLRVSVKSLGDFTSKLGNLKAGAKVIIDGPLGIFTLDQAVKQKFFLIAGGIGITPLRALAETLGQEKKDAVLFYANSSAKDIPLQSELASLPIRQYFPISEASTEVLPPLQRGRIDKEKIVRLVPDFKEREIYICGPKPMMDAVRGILRELGVERRFIHFEKFSY
ncbi:MAG: hypothetical protein A2836_03890 [Candidatus Taylorbacteria bacterium RIFCSPHIGHO2_01_FULL_45_63]|nr:MAG: hypothetical protein A2836_03890 [Candidatus Taylorbacteria bacterium RIFCSPHIGHO2_01_FULL_45_63]OHA34367.1 MAG: hypothetical protein A3A22_00590 [Candidatus Taylorbacteria bacterium RIFCSPLOWO2_01_FULL_45_34b]